MIVDKVDLLCVSDEVGLLVGEKVPVGLVVFDRRAADMDCEVDKDTLFV